MKTLIFWGLLFLACMAGYGVNKQDYGLAVYCVTMVFVLCVDSIVDVIRKKNEN